MKKTIKTLLVMSAFGLLLAGCGSTPSSADSSSINNSSAEASISSVNPSSDPASTPASDPASTDPASSESGTKGWETSKGSTSDATSQGTGSKSDSQGGGVISQEESEEEVSLSAPEGDDYTFYGVTEFTAPVEIHTAAQKEFLSYQGDYSKMPTNLYPDGQQNLSNSEPVKVNWGYKAPSGKNVSSFSVIYGKEVNLSDGYEVNVGTKTSAKLYNPYLGDNYFKIVAYFSDGTKEETGIKNFVVDSTYPRNLTIDKFTNCRDIGGRTTEDGGKIKQGLVYRTCGNRYNTRDSAGSTISDAGRKEMLEHLKVKTEVNVSNDQSYNVNLSGTTVKNLLMDYDQSGTNSSHHFSRNAESVKNFFKLVADSNNYPLYYHCRIGTDRTGLCSILLGGLLGVSLNELYQDYLFSNFGLIQEKRYIGEQAGQDNIENYIAEINSIKGTSFKNKVYNTLLAIGVPEATLDQVIANLTDGPVASGNSANQIVATADVLRTNNVSVTTDTSDRNNPDKYIVLDSSSKSATLEFSVNASYKGQIVAYLGNSEHSSTKKIGNAISCRYDSAAVSIPDVTYAKAGMGNCGGRMNYYPVILGEVNLTPGSHTITITGTSEKMNLGTLCVF